MEDSSELDELKAALVARDADLAAERAHRVALEKQIAKLTETVRELREQLGRNSSNSNKPPSSDPPSAKQLKKKKPKGRRRGGQKGHRGSRRELLPPERVDRFEDLYPAECQSCWKPLPETPDAFAKRYQLTELKPLAVHTTEWRRHAVVCPCCGYKTRAKYDPDVLPRFSFGPRLMAVVALLTGVYHLSRRQTVRLLRELLGVRMSLGSVSAIERRVSEQVEPAVDEAHEAAKAAAIKHADGTSWLRSGVMLSLWVLATAAVTVFTVLENGRRETLKVELFGRVRGILVSDRATALKFWTMNRRQICWAHLVRKFISFSERDGPAGAIGTELVEYSRLLFLYWRQLQQGELERATFVARIAPVRQQVEATLQRGKDAKIRGLSGSCEDILEHREALWTFVNRADQQPRRARAARIRPVAAALLRHAERAWRSFRRPHDDHRAHRAEAGPRRARLPHGLLHTGRRDALAPRAEVSGAYAPIGK